MVISLNDGLDVVEEVGSDHFGLHLDVKAMAADSSRSVADTIRAAKGSRLLHFHANDPNLRGPGFGEMDFAPIFQALKEIGYDRWVSVEVFDYAPDPRTIAEKSLEYMKRASGEAGVR
jgi:sugar phosphate isomerase/epimerase